MNTPVSYPLADHLKEKGINIWSEYRYTDFNGIERLEKNASEIFPYAPTISDVVMWLYEKHGIWIEVSCHTVLDEKDDDIEIDVFYFVARKLKPVDILYSGDFVNSPTEAYEAAIDYTLNNLL